MTEQELARRPITWVDLVFAAAVAGAQIVGTQIIVRAGGGWVDVPTYAMLIAIAAPVVIRDRFPRAALLAVVVLSAAYVTLGLPGGFFTVSLAVMLWSAVAAGHRILAFVGAASVVAALALAGLVGVSGHAADADGPVWLAGWLVAAYVLGEVSRSRRRYVEEVEGRALEAERTREEEARRRAGEERLRIARELHDTLAHNISMISVQAGVASHLLDRQPEQARAALVAITDASREALRELRDVLGVLRQVDEAEPLDPTPGLERLGDLTDRIEATGLVVDVVRTGEPRRLPVSVDHAAYRIVQEALTNVTRHAQAERAVVTLTYGPDELEIRVEDEGAQTSARSEIRPGNGLTGMRERAVSIGGSFDAGWRADGGFRVHSRLPIGGDAR